MKICSKCHQEKPESEYSKSKRGLNGLRSNCKTCDRIRCKIWKDKNPDKVNATNKKRDIKRKEKPEAEMVRRAKRRSIKNNIECTITERDIYIPETCPVLGQPLIFSNSRSINRFAPSLDRISSDRGYIPDNIQVISYKANTMKSDASEEELQKFALWVLENTQLSQETINRIKELNERIHQS